MKKTFCDECWKESNDTCRLCLEIYGIGLFTFSPLYIDLCKECACKFLEIKDTSVGKIKMQDLSEKTGLRNKLKHLFT